MNYRSDESLAIAHARLLAEADAQGAEAAGITNAEIVRRAMQAEAERLKPEQEAIRERAEQEAEAERTQLLAEALLDGYTVHEFNAAGTEVRLHQLVQDALLGETAVERRAQEKMAEPDSPYGPF